MTGTVFIVEVGEYSDRRVDSVWPTREEAEARAKEVGVTESEGDVVQFWLGKPRPQYAQLFHVAITVDGGMTFRWEAPTFQIKEDHFWKSDRGSYLGHVFCYARDGEHAMKITADRFAAWKGLRAQVVEDQAKKVAEELERRDREELARLKAKYEP